MNFKRENKEISEAENDKKTLEENEGDELMNQEKNTIRFNRVGINYEQQAIFLININKIVYKFDIKNDVARWIIPQAIYNPEYKGEVLTYKSQINHPFMVVYDELDFDDDANICFKFKGKNVQFVDFARLLMLAEDFLGIDATDFDHINDQHSKIMDVEGCDKIVDLYKFSNDMDQEQDVMRRYWIGVTVFDEFKTDELMKELNEVGELWNGDIEEHYVHKDFYESHEEAIEVIKRYKDVLRNHDVDDVDAWVECKTQPICPNCGKLGRFSESECSNCGTELLKSEYVAG